MLARIVREAVEAEIDSDAVAEAEAVEGAEREAILGQLAGLRKRLLPEP